MVSRYSAHQVFDDAYMFQRYADNLIEYGRLCWDPGKGPVYGMTSVFHALVVAAFRLVTDADSCAGLLLSSAFLGALFFASLAALLVKRLGSPARVNWTAVIFVFCAAAMQYGPLTRHFTSGMDTTGALVFLTVYIFLLTGINESSSLPRSFLTGAFGAFALWVRPELCLYAFITPVAAFLIGGRGTRARYAALILGAFAALAMQMAAAKLYFGSPLPLSFFLKSSRDSYGQAFLATYAYLPYHFFFKFLTSNAPLILPIILSLFLCARSCFREESAVAVGLLLSTFAFLSYQLLFVLQIMGYQARFYYPCFPAIAYLGGLGVVRLEERLGGGEGKLASFVSGKLRPILISVLTLVMALQLVQSFRAYDAEGELVREWGQIDFRVDYRRYWSDYWFALEELAGLPDDAVIASTEVGMLGVMAPKKIIVDLAGLNETEFATRGFSADLLFAKYNPDIIYMPHRHYEVLNRELRESDYFKSSYELFTAEELGARMGIALRKDSRHFAAARSIIRIKMALAAQDHPPTR